MASGTVLRLVEKKTYVITVDGRIFRCTEIMEEIVSCESPIIDLTNDDVIDLTITENYDDEHASSGYSSTHNTSPMYSPNYYTSPDHSPVYDGYNSPPIYEPTTPPYTLAGYSSTLSSPNSLSLTPSPPGECCNAATNM